MRESELEASGPADATATADDQAAEIDLWTGRTSWKHFAGRIISLLAASAALLTLEAFVAPGAIVVTLLLCLLVLIIVLLGVALRVFSTHYRLTNERLFIVRGILTQTTDQIELIRVDDLRLTKRMTERLFGLGTIEVLSTDFTDRSVRIEGVHDADRVAELIRSNMRTARKRSLFIENL